MSSPNETINVSLSSTLFPTVDDVVKSPTLSPTLQDVKSAHVVVDSCSTTDSDSDNDVEIKQKKLMKEILKLRTENSRLREENEKYLKEIKRVSGFRGIARGTARTTTGAERHQSRPNMHGGGDHSELREAINDVHSRLVSVQTDITRVIPTLNNLTTEEIMYRAPNIVKLSTIAESVLSSIDSVLPVQCGTPAESRFEFSIQQGSDPGQPDFYRGCPSTLPSLEDSVKVDIYQGYYECDICGAGVKGSNLQHHNDDKHRDAQLNPLRPQNMTPDWVIKSASKFPA
eukprot:PhF_6_TR20612/c0_g1_i1/m.29707